MNLLDKIFIGLMGLVVVSACLTVVSYVLYSIFNIGFDYFSFVFFICSIFSACCMMLVGVMVLFNNPNVIYGVR